MPYVLRKAKGSGVDIYKRVGGRLKKKAHANSKRNAGIYAWKADGGGRRMTSTMREK